MCTYIKPLRPVRIKAEPGDIPKDMTQSCPDLRKRSGGNTKWDPRNKIYADWNDELEDERRAGTALMMRMYN